MITRYYLGIAVKLDTDEFAKATADMARFDCWVWATWPDGRRFRHWAEQLRPTAWA